MKPIDIIGEHLDGFFTFVNKRVFVTVTTQQLSRNVLVLTGPAAAAQLQYVANICCYIPYSMFSKDRPEYAWKVVLSKNTKSPVIDDTINIRHDSFLSF